MDYLDNKKELVVGQVTIMNLRELLAYLKQADTFSERQKIYSWIKNSVKDPVLARKFRKVKYKKNYIEFLEKRIDYLNKVKKGLEKTKVQVNLNLYVTKAKLVLDKEKCIRCNVGHIICPKEAVEVIEQNILINDKCVLCGICVPFCPTGALNLEINDEALLKDANPLPDLADYEKINGVMIRRLFDGWITVEDTSCPEECEYCVAACPIGIIERDGKKVLIDKDKCVHCGACEHACPDKLIEVKRNRIYHEDGFSAAWTEIVEKLLGKKKVNIMLNQKSHKKIREIINE